MEGETVEDGLAEGWVFSVVQRVELVQFVEVELVVVVSDEAVETVDGGDVEVNITPVVVDGWDGVVNDITTVDEVEVLDLMILFVDLTEDGDEIDLVTEDGFVDFGGDDIFLQEDLDKEDITAGHIREVNVVSVELTEDGEEVDLAADDGFEDLWGDDVLLEEDLDEEDITLGDGVEVGELSVDLTDDLVKVDLSTDDGFVDFWGDDLLVEEDLDEEDITVGDFGEVEVLSVDLTEDGEEIGVAADDGLEDLWGDDVLLEEDVQEKDVIDLLGNNLGEDLLDWDNLLLNLDINDLGFFNNKLALSGDGLNNNLLLSDQSLDISLNLSVVSDKGLVLEEGLVDLVQEELVVGWGGSSVWQVLTSEPGGGESITVVVNVWKDILVPVVDIVLPLEEVLRVDILLLAIVLLVQWEVVLGDEELNKGGDVLVEVDGVQEVLTESRDLPELLEVGGAKITLEGWVLDVLADKGETQVVLTEELGLVELLEGEDLIDVVVVDNIVVVVVVDSLESFQVKFSLNWVTLFHVDWELVDQLLLQQQVIDDWPGVQQGFLLDETEGVQIEAASGDGCDKSDEDKSFHDDFVAN